MAELTDAQKMSEARLQAAREAMGNQLPKEYEDLTPEQEASLPPVKDPTKNVPYWDSAERIEETYQGRKDAGFPSEYLMETIQAFSPEGGETPEEARAKTEEYLTKRKAVSEAHRELSDKVSKKEGNLEDLYGTPHRGSLSQVSESLLKLHGSGHLTLSPELLRDAERYVRALRKYYERGEGVQLPYHPDPPHPTDYDEEFGVPVKRFRDGKPEAPGKE